MIPGRAPKRPLVFGLTGGVASGKSTAGRTFAELGVPVIDADAVARELRDGEAKSWIEKRFGTADAGRLREIVFGNPEAKRDLEAILHPLIRERSEEIFLSHAESAPYVVYEAALLIETGRERDFDGLIVVGSVRETQVERLMKRDGIPRELASQMVDAQMSSAEKEARATHLLRNDGTLENLKSAVRALHATLRARSG